jgi:uncharacterized protein (TIGR04255 family)
MQIDLEEKFPNLDKAPIIEAIIHWKVTPSRKLDSKDLDQIQAALPSYRSEHLHSIAAKFAQEDDSVSMEQQTAWDGLKLSFAENDTDKFIAQIKPLDLVVSQLAPYKNWEEFTGEALKCWNLYCSLVEPTGIGRIGVRFISELHLTNSKPDDWIDLQEPLRELGLLTSSFFHKDTFEFPPYSLNLIRAIRDSPRSLIVDIDVARIDVDVEDMDQCLSEMRHLKNRVFFTYMKNATTEFRESS